MSSKSIPKETTLIKWNDRFSRLKIIDVVSEKKIIYKVFTGQEEKLKLVPIANLSFINGSINVKMSALYDHATTDGHTLAIREQENEETVLKKLLDSAHHIAVRGRPFTDFKDHIQLEKFTESNFNLIHMIMKAVVGISSKPSRNFFFKKICTRNFYE